MVLPSRCTPAGAVAIEKVIGPPDGSEAVIAYEYAMPSVADKDGLLVMAGGTVGLGSPLPQPKQASSTTRQPTREAERMCVVKTVLPGVAESQRPHQEKQLSAS